MAIQYVGGRGAGRAGSTSTVNVAINSGLTGGIGAAAIAGDLVVVVVSTATQARQPSCAIATPAGYTPLTVQRTTATTYDTNVQVCYKIMGGTPDTSVTIPSTGNIADGQAYRIMVFRGVDPATPMDQIATYATGTAVSNRPDGAAITPVTAGAWIVVGGGGAASTGTTLYTAAELSGFVSYNGADTNDGTVGMGYYSGWSSGAYNPAAWGGGSANAANSWGATTLALRPYVIPAVSGDAAHIQTTQTSLAGGAEIFAGADAQSQEPQSCAATGEQIVDNNRTGDAVHGQPIQFGTAAGEEIFNAQGIHLQPLQTIAGEGAEVFISAITQAQVLQAQGAQGQEIFTGEGTQAQPAQSHAAEAFQGVLVFGSVSTRGFSQVSVMSGTVTAAAAPVLVETFTVPLGSLTSSRRTFKVRVPIRAVSRTRQRRQRQRKVGEAKSLPVGGMARSKQLVAHAEGFAIRDYEARNQREILEVLEALVA